MTGDGALDPIDPQERDVELAWELFDAQPDHPEVGRLAGQILAQQPDRTGIRILLALHRRACGAIDEAREILLGVAGQRDAHFVSVARKLRDLERAACDFAEARRWAEVVLREEPEHGQDWIELGAATALSGDLEAGWQLMDDGVARCFRSPSDDLLRALASRVVYLAQSFAPPARFIAAAEEALRVDVASEFVGGPLAWAYAHEGRFGDAEDLALRLLRLDPTDGVAAALVSTIRELRALVDQGEVTFEDIHESGVFASGWAELRDAMFGLDLASALAALDGVMPGELAASLRSPLDEEAAQRSPGEPAILAWHDGQEVGTGAAWGVGPPFRLMSATEIEAMDEAIEADPTTYPRWQQSDLTDHYVQVMTDDAGGYLIATLDAVLTRRDGADDVVVAPTLADWFWDRVAAFGGRDPRPVHRRHAGGA